MKIILLLLLLVPFASLIYAENSPDYTEAKLEWSKHNFGIINGTGTAKIILTDFDAPNLPNYIDTVTVFVYSDSFPEGIDLELYETEKNSGIFERTFSLSDTRSAPSILYAVEGDTAIVTYFDDTLPSDHVFSEIYLNETTLIGLLGYPLERVPATNARIDDLNDNPVVSPYVGEQVVLLSDIVNQQDHTQKFIWLAQVVDDQRKTVSLAWIDGTLNPESHFSPSVSWIPERVGDYTVTMFVWQSIDNPTALSPPVELEFSVIQESPSHGGPPIPFYDSELMLSFDSSIYHPVLGDDSPLMYKETGESVLDETNCDRYAFWMTKHQKEKIELHEDYSRYPPWGNQIFPLVDYCLENGDLKKIIAENKIYWSFYRTDGGVENEN